MSHFDTKELCTKLQHSHDNYIGLFGRLSYSGHRGAYPIPSGK
jgi:hypothetical protein